MDGQPFDKDGGVSLIVAILELAIADVGDTQLPVTERVAAQDWLTNGGTSWVAGVLNVDETWLHEQVVQRLDAEPLIEDGRVSVGDGVEQYMLAGFETIG